MNITFKNSNEVDFRAISCGDTFIDPEYDEGTILLRVKAVCDVTLGTDPDFTEFDGYAVDIQTGELQGYYNSNKVIPVRAEVEVKR